MKSLIYSEQAGSFQSFSDIDPVHFMHIGDELFYVGSNGNVYKRSPELPSSYKDAVVRIITNQDLPYTKIFDNIELYAGYDNVAEITSVEFNTSTTSSVLNGVDIKLRESTYMAAIPRGENETRLRDKYLEATYNIKGVDDKKFSIPYIKTKYRYSLI